MSNFIAERIWPGAAVERSIFGTGDAAEIWAQVLELVPDAESCFAFEVSVGGLLGLRLRDGSRVALKLHVAAESPERLRAIQRVQRHFAESGFPCPRPLGVRGRATLEEWRDDGAYREAREDGVRPVIAEHLARLHRLTSDLQPPDGMTPHFAHKDDPLWPAPHNVLFDFAATASGAEWIDEIARRAKPIRDSHVRGIVVGHGDWTVKHFRFDCLRPTVIYDWDSLTAASETTIVGAAAASFTYTEHVPTSVWPTLDEARAFIADYVRARGKRFEPAEQRAVEAAAVYNRAYAARCAHAVGKDAHGVDLADYADVFL